MSGRRDPKKANAGSSKNNTAELDAQQITPDIKNSKQPDEFAMQLSEFRKEIMELLEKFTSTQNESFRKICSEMTGLRDQMKNIVSTQDSITNEQSSLKLRVADLENKQRESNTMICQLQTHINDLRNDFEAQQQRDRLCNLEITGVPEMKNESVADIVMEIAKYANVEMKTHDILHATRVQPRRALSGRPKTIICKLQPRLLKDSIIAGIRKNRGVTSKDIGIPGESRPIFVNEHLTIHYKDLLKQTKTTAEKKHYKFVWVRNCRIFVRKNDSSPAIPIFTENDLLKIV